MAEQATSTQATIRLLGNKNVLGVQFEPPLDESQLFDAMLPNCPVRAVNRGEEGGITGIVYEYHIYGVQDDDTKVQEEFINRYSSIAHDLGRTIAGQNMNARQAV